MVALVAEFEDLKAIARGVLTRRGQEGSAVLSVGRGRRKRPAVMWE